MRKLVLIILIVAIIAVMFTACDKPQEEQPQEQPTFEQRVIEYACKEMGWETQEVSTLTLVHTEYVPWLKCECYTYILTRADGSQWLVGARENADGFYCDVECEV